MASTKRKHVANASELSGPTKSKKSKLLATKSSSKHEKKSAISANSRKQPDTKTPSGQTDLVESDTTESENGFYGFSAKESSNNQMDEDSSDDGQSGTENGVTLNSKEVPELPKLPRGKMAGKNERAKLKAIKNGTVYNETCKSFQFLLWFYFSSNILIRSSNAVVTRDTCEAERAGKRAESCEAKC